MKLSTLGVPLLCVLITACAPSVSIEKMGSSNEATVLSPTETQVPFALRSSDIYILPASASSSDSSGASPGNIKPADVCQPTKTPTNTVLRSQPPPIASNWQECLSRIQLVATPNRGNVYLATAQTNTTISVTSLDADPLLLKTVTIVKTHSTSDTITSMGADVAAGVAVGGPFAIGVGSVAALYVLSEATVPQTWIVATNHEKQVGKNQRYLALVKLPDNPMWATPGARIRAKKGSLFCEGSTDDYDFNSYHYDEHPIASLMLPITAPIDFDKKNEGSKEFCWKPLPGVIPSEQTPAHPPALWFYRVVTTDPASPDKKDSIEFPPVITLSRQDDHGGTIFDVNHFPGSAPAQFPTSACRLVEVDVVWWQELDKEDGKPPQYAKYKMTVADPSHVQVVSVPDQKSELITFNPVCGAYVSNTTAPTPITDGFSALIQAAQTVKKAEPAPTKSGGTSN